jgi:hypothetical protein
MEKNVGHYRDLEKLNNKFELNTIGNVLKFTDISNYEGLAAALVLTSTKPTSIRRRTAEQTQLALSSTEEQSKGLFL